MRKTWILGSAVALVLLGAGGAYLSGLIKLPGGQAVAKAGKVGKDGKKPEVPLEFIQREIVQPALARLPSVLEFSGPLVAPQTAMVRAKTGGTLLALNVAEGSRVQAGQVMGRIEQAELGSRVAERGAQLESARATLAQAERTHQSNERLAQQQFISPNALENSRAALDTARAQLNAAQASLETPPGGPRPTPAFWRPLRASWPSAMCCPANRSAPSNRC